MTWAVNQPRHGARWHHEAMPSVRLARPLRVGVTGLSMAVLGAWGAIVAFVGPEFGYHATEASSWQWTTTNWLLHLVPGAMALVAGLMILGLSPSVRVRGALGLAALMAIVAGAWFVIGPALWPWFESSPAYGPATSAGTSFVNQVGANLGVGVLVSILGGMALKTAMATRAAATTVDGTAAGTPATAAGTPATAAGTPATAPASYAAPESRAADIPEA
jgi:hypothetical protein